MATTSVADDLLQYIHASPTPYHAVAETARRLEAAGYHHLEEADSWSLKSSERFYTTRAGTSLIAFQLGKAPVDRAGFRLVGAHTDSPNLRLKPNPVFTKAGCAQLGVEVYGGALWYTWLDRDLSLAGRVVVLHEGRSEHRLLNFARPIGRIPSLAIHLNRQVNTDGLKLNPQEHLAPLVALLTESEGAFDLKSLLATELSRQGRPVTATDILAFDLSLYDVQAPSRSGFHGEFLHSARLDNLASCHAGLSALLNGPTERDATCGIVLYDHEEVGSRSAQGAASPFLRSALERILIATNSSGARSGASGGDRSDGLHRALAQSMLVSADMAHALHPNYADRHEPRHAPILGRGPVLKSNVNQSYATDGETWGVFEALCREVGVTLQHFVTRSDLPCGSTIGPITAGELGIRVVDVGSPMLSMHSIRESAAASDIEAMVKLLTRFFR